MTSTNPEHIYSAYSLDTAQADAWLAIEKVARSKVHLRYQFLLLGLTEIWLIQAKASLPGVRI